ncbi:MAG: hypothetical protein H6R16_1235 [Proteobacteria bacterium]|uniref:FecR protein domain-containing protein n=1 Tax=Dechloromonas aromatica (strain RCB) TaxID=159087 RepID=Q47ET6_DECAR|nr:hypothetical protein [Pseudomonadota bacterium]
MKIISRWFFIALLPIASAFAESSETVGHIQTLQGQAFIQRAGTTLPAAIGAELRKSDQIRTGKPAAVGIVLTDDTTISLGSNSELSLSDYAFEPKQSKFALSLKMIKGTFSYITGQIVKLSPDSARIQTPDATIAVRGTKLLVEIKD